MSTLIFVAAAVFVLSAVSLLVAWKRAVQGYEDESGFHPGVDHARASTPSVELNHAKPRRARAPRSAAV